jgi:type II secretory ATPase GspE/PulE/Tfp pilus assembly ATPase PilB-like protein
MAAKELVYDALLRRSTDIHLEPKDSELSVRLRVDGVMYPAEPFDRPTGDAVLNIFKVLSAMDITEKRRAQDGSFRAELEDRNVDFRVATQGTRHGEKMSLRILDQSNSVNSLAGLGLRKQLQIKLLELIHQPHGLLLVCGPTGAGKSTTLYAALSDIDAYQTNVITVEDPIEYNIANVNQIEINTKAGQTFATSLRSILRQDPDVVMIGEIRDGETAEIACQAANTGHMVFSTVHANDTITALYRVIELGVEPFMIANSLSAVLAQRLVRRLCNTCREAYKPTREFMEKAGLPADRIDTFYRPPKEREEICQSCGGLGYMGRIGVFELLVITEKMRDLIREKAPLNAIRAEARKNGMLYMREEALRLLARGVTSIAEIQRVVQ